VGGDLPENIIDGDKSTAFCFVKPGKSYNGIAVPSDHVPSFTIDMKQRNAISYFRYAHRTGINEATLRVKKVSLYGKNDSAGEFIPIVEDVAFEVSRDEERIDFPPATYRYVQLRYNDWDKSGGNTVQVAEFDLGPAPDDDDDPVTPPADSSATGQPSAIWGSAATEEAPYILYPNPVKRGRPFCISSKSLDKKVERNTTVRIYDATGKKIREKVTFATPIVDVLYTAGIFFVSVESSLGRKVFKLMVSD
jgi:hypothetical protein